MSTLYTARALLEIAICTLEQAGLESARADARVLLAAALSVPLSRLDLHLADAVPGSAREQMERFVGERASRRPLAYVTGETEFMGLRFRCDERALVPRPETEMLVEAVGERLAGDERPQLLLDVGTGTGAIGLSLVRRRPGLRALLTDLSPEALALAAENAEALGVSDRVRLLPGRDLEPVEQCGLGGEVTCLVSNPPYIAPRDVASLPPEVAAHEPAWAWRGEGEEGTGFYERIVPRCPSALPRLRLAAFEVGIGQAARVARVCRATWRGSRVDILRDLSGIERVVITEAADG